MKPVCLYILYKFNLKLLFMLGQKIQRVFIIQLLAPSCKVPDNFVPVLNKLQYSWQINVKGNVHPRKGHEVPNGE
jgi:hypothetical protein